MKTFICWHWRQPRWANTYRTEHVNALARMLQVHATDYRLVCITDARNLSEYECETHPLWRDKRLVVKTRSGHPNCYQRLKLFDTDVQKIFGDDLVSIDLDCLILDNIDGLFADNDLFRICKGAAAPYNGSMWRVRAGVHQEVYDHFDPLSSPGEAGQQRGDNGKKYYGSDQAWMSYKIKGARLWTTEDGVYQFNNHLKDKKRSKEDDRGPKGPPKNAKIIFFAGLLKPWMMDMMKKHPWIHDRYLKFMVRRDGN